MTASDNGTLLSSLVKSGHDQTEAIDLGSGIYVNLGVGNSYLVTTDDGNVIVNAGTLREAKRGRALFSAKSDAPVRYVILTQSHVNQYGGVELFMGAQTHLVAHRRYPAARRYVAALREYYGRRSQKLWGSIVGDGNQMAPTREYDPDILIDDSYGFELGGRRFELLSTPGGETRDSLILWLPGDATAIVGNLFGPIFGHQPNLNTVRGDKPRSALEFIDSVKRVRDLEPETILTGHETIKGKVEISQTLNKIIDAVQWLQDETIAGMNAGKDIHTLMREVTVPPHLTLGEGHGKAAWNIRAIWAEYTGWFDFDSTTSLYAIPSASVAPDLVMLAGGPVRLAEQAMTHLDAGRPLEALHLAEIALVAAPSSVPALTVKMGALELLFKRGGSENLSETMWLRNEMASVSAALGEA